MTDVPQRFWAAPESASAMSDRPHRAIRFIAVLTSASLIGATLGWLVGPSLSLGRAILALAIVLLAVAGAAGIVKNEAVITALVALGLVLLSEAIPDLTAFLFLGSLGLVIAALLAGIQEFLARRRDD